MIAELFIFALLLAGTSVIKGWVDYLLGVHKIGPRLNWFLSDLLGDMFTIALATYVWFVLLK